MAGTAPRLPEQYFPRESHTVEFQVSELVSDAAGAHSPFGDTEFPVPADTLLYVHPTAENRPNLADGN